MTDKPKLDQDFEAFNLDIERAKEKEIARIRKEIDALKEKADKMGEALLSPVSNEAEGTIEEKS